MTPTPVVIFLLGFTLAAAATPAVRAFARRIGAVAAPKRDRWHTAPTAMMGGIAIFAATLIALFTLTPRTPQTWIVVAASTALFFVGLIDDFVHLKPYQKLIGQLLGSAGVVYFGLVLPWTGSFVVNMIITFFWLVGVTNAVNMLDNMDGLAAGVAAIAALSLAVNFFLIGQPAEAMMLAAFCGALVGFLIYNRNPASIFMGDCGSMFAGFFLASTALLSQNAGGGRSRSVVAVLAVPVLVLCIPIFDTTFVTLMRKLAGRSASQGGRDHTSHRLVALGLSERHAVWMLYAFAFLGGALAVSVRGLGLDRSIAAIAAFSILLTMLGVYLGGVKVYSEEEVSTARKKPLVAFLFDISYKRRIFEVALDVLLISLAYYFAYALAFGPVAPTSKDWSLFFSTLPAIVFVKLATFLAMGMYRGLWRYASISDVALHVKTVAAASLVSLLAIFAFNFEGYFSRTVLVVDAVLLLAFVSGSRLAFRAIRGLMPMPHARTGRRVIIFGAGDGGELLYREFRNNAMLRCLPVAFLDDDPRKVGKLLHGLRVHSGEERIGELCQQLRVEEIVLSTQISAQRLRQLVESCARAGVAVRRMNIELQRIADTELGWVLPTDTVIPTAIAAPVVTEKGPLLLIEKRESHGTPASSRP